MGELNERYADVVEQLDGWIKSYIKEICSGFEPSVMKLYVENTFEDLRKVALKNIIWDIFHLK